MAKTVVVMLHRDRYPPAMQAAFATSACKCAGAEFRTINKPYSVANARNKAVRTMYDMGYDSLLFVDEDVSIQSDCVLLLQELGAPIAAGQVPTIREMMNLEIPYIPIITGDKEDTGEFSNFEFKWLGESREIVRAGTACMLIQREVFDELGFPWFRWPADLFEGDNRGEDLDFCDRARKLGFKIMVHADVRCGHNVAQDAGSRLVEPEQVPHDVTWNGPISRDERYAYPAWASHIPVLRTLAEEYQIDSVVEFGLGKYSTAVFLDREHFPDLQRLISFEHNTEWKDLILASLDDDRLEIAFSDLGAMASRAQMVAVPDLVFIDCDGEADGDVAKPCNEVDGYDFHTYKARQAIFDRYADSDAIVVIHDVNEKEMAGIVNSSRYRYSNTYRSPGGEETPDTSVFSNKHDVTGIQWRYVRNDRKWGVL